MYTADMIVTLRKQTLAMIVACLVAVPSCLAAAIALVSWIPHSHQPGNGEDMLLLPGIFIGNVIIDSLLVFLIRGIYRKNRGALTASVIAFPVFLAADLALVKVKSSQVIFLQLVGLILGVLVVSIFVRELKRNWHRA
jgi:hypothetical protein